MNIAGNLSLFNARCFWHISIVSLIQLFTTVIVKLTWNCLTRLFWCAAEPGFSEDFSAVEFFILYIVLFPCQKLSSPASTVASLPRTLWSLLT